MLPQSLRARLRGIEIPSARTEPCANPQCEARTRIWHGYIGVGRQFYFGNLWCCSPECFQAAVWHALCRAIIEPKRSRPHRHRLPLGLLLLADGLIDHDAIRDALELQRTHQTGRIGDWLQKLGVVTEQQVTDAVARQWSCAVYPLQAGITRRNDSDLVPYPILKSLRMLPVHHNVQTQTLHVAFCDRVDYPALHVIEQMLGVVTVPCIARESQIQSALEGMIDRLPPFQQVFNETYETHEMAKICRTHFVQAEGKNSKVLRCGDYLWVRIFAKNPRDLVFRNKWMLREGTTPDQDAREQD
jgi:hypothetical protein